MLANFHDTDAKIADPVAYDPIYGYTGLQIRTPTRPMPGDQLDAEFAAIKTASDQAVAAIKDVRRSDGALKNGVVSYDSLSTDMKSRLATAGVDVSDLSVVSHIFLTMGTMLLTDFMSATGKTAVPIGTSFALTPDVTAEIQSALNALEALGGGDLLFPRGQVKVDTTTIKIPTNCQIRGIPNLTKVLIGNGYTGSQEVFQNKTATADGSLTNPGIKILDTWFDGTNRAFPLWLTNAAGVAISDPQADYRVGGCLAPTTFASISLTVSGGAVTAVTINSGGTGYVYPPTLWVSGDGYGALINLTISGGAVTGYFIEHGGVGYTAATAEVAGGGANPATALVAANRRNANWNTYGGLISLDKADRPVVRRCRFTNYGGMVILDRGCHGRVVEDNDFENCGSIDNEAVLIWSQSYGDPASAPAYYRHTTNGVFRGNRIKNCNRSVATIGDHDGDYSENTIAGWGESCFFVVDAWAKGYTVARNKAKNGRLTDIVCRFVEGGDDANVFDNVIENVDGAAISVIGNGAMVSRNTIKAPAAFSAKYPFGPYSERVGYGLGAAAIAGRPIAIYHRAAVIAASATNDAADSPKAVRIQGNTLIANDNGNAYLHAVSFSKGVANSIGPVLIEGFDITRSLSTILFDPVAADACLNKNKPFRVINNPGHASMGAKLIHETITSGTTGTKKWTFGFRPRVLFVNARASVSSVAHTFAFYADEEARNPGTTGGTNTSGGLIQAAVTTVPAVTSGSSNPGGLFVSTTAGVVFQASAIGFSSDGWSMSIFTNSSDCIFEVIAIP